MNIGFVGAGGIGSYYAGLLSRAGHGVLLLARGDHLAAIVAKGLEVRTPEESFVVNVPATADETQLASCDYIVVAVKGYSLGDVGETIARAAKNGATVVPLLNGIDVADRLVALGVPRESIIGGLARVSLVRSAPGVVERLTPFAKIVLGEFDGVSRHRTTQLVAALQLAGAEARVSDDIIADLWKKFAFIIPIAVTCGLSRGPMGPVLATERGRELLAGSLREVLAVSSAAGVRISDADADTILHDLMALAPGMRPSFLYDLERGGPTEGDFLAGAVSRIGHLHGVPTPINDVAAAAFEIATQP
ncbi:MAG: ketopantoate reductase family protein [bacterium]